MRRDDIVAGLAASALMAVLFVALFGLGYLRYRECRAHGFSVFYCVSMK